MLYSSNFVYDSEGNLIEDRSKNLKISYDWRGMPVEFRMETRAGNVLENTRSCSRGDSLMLAMAYDGSGRRVSKTRYSKACVSDEADGVYAADWERELVTHYTGIGTEVRENYRDGSLQNARVVVKSLQGERRKNKFTCFYDRAAAAYAEGVHMPQGLGRYGVEDAEKPSSGNATFEWYLKNHLGSTMLVYGTQGSSNANVADLGEVKKAYDYRSFGEQIDLIADAGDKVTENFTGKERDDETQLSNHGARMLDPMLGIWISVDPKRFFPSPYLYMGNGYNPIRFADLNGERPGDHFDTPNQAAEDCLKYYSSMSNKKDVEYFVFVWKLNDGKYATNTKMFEGSVDAFGEEQILSAAQKNLPMDFDYVVAGAHLHGGVNQEYDSERFSEADYSNFVKPLSIDLYLMTPEESFQRMDVDGNVEFLKEMPEIDVK